MRSSSIFALTGALALALAAAPAAAQFKTKYTTPQIKGLNGWQTSPVFTIGETLPTKDPRFPKGYMPVGTLDGIGAMRLDHRTVRIFVNHEFSEAVGRSYKLKNGTELTGARISCIDLDRSSREVRQAGLAYDTVYDRDFLVVTKPSQINEAGDPDDPRNLDPRSTAGFSRFCSSQLSTRGTFGLVDDVYFTGEETGDPGFHPNGGSLWALDVAKGTLWAVPSAGRAAWENTTVVNVGKGRVGLLIGDDNSPQDRNNPLSSAGTSTKPEDTIAAPLWLYVGRKNASKGEIAKALPSKVAPPKDSFLDRNGLLVGDLYYFVMEDPKVTDARQFHGHGAWGFGHWKKIEILDEKMAGKPGYDAMGYKDSFTLRVEAKDGGAFQFSRPEDVATMPWSNGRGAVLASTGRGRVFGGADKWGVLYQVYLHDNKRLDRKNSTVIRVAYDGNDKGNGDFGLRSPDNVAWADDHVIYAQEDDAISSSDAFYEKGVFGETSKEEASIWAVHPTWGAALRIAQIDRSVVVPTGTTDAGIGDIGNWESSGVLDVSDLFQTRPWEKLMIATVQAHGIRDGVIATEGLGEGGQLFFLTHTWKWWR
ncbi:MAG: PEP-CTERM sorting domain-containing protein [Planctomycetota bacterium]